jgi:hypothetical protein
VNKAYRAVLANGGKDNSAPGLRPQFDPPYYAANVLAPNGATPRKIREVCAEHAPARRMPGSVAIVKCNYIRG